MRKLFSVLVAIIVFQSSTFKAFGQNILQESFEGSFPPPGWTLVNNGAGNVWAQNTSATYSYDGNNSMYYGYNVSNAADAWAFTPSLALNANPVTVSFYVRVYSGSYPENLKLTIGPDNVVAHHTEILIDSAGISNTTFTQWQVTYTPSAAGNYTFGFNCYSPAFQWNLYVDSVTIFQQLNTCTGKPNAGVLNGPSSICSGVPFGLSALGTTLAGGISYQWQSNTDSVNWVDIIGETSSTYTASQSVATQYRLRVTCDSTKDTSYSTILNVAVTPALICSYCSPNNGTTLHTGTTPSIDSVSITGTTLNNANIGEPGNGYTQFPILGNSTATLQQAVSYNLVTKFSGATIASVWIDWDQSGTYDASEWTQITTTGSGVITTSITVPSTAKLGITGIRIRSRAPGNPNGSGDGCTQFGSGETEEYLINVIANTACLGKPTAGVAYSVASACAGNNVTLSDSASSMAIGIVYQWQYSGDKKTWTDLSGATSVNYSFTIADSAYYRLKVLCTASNDSAYSNAIWIGLNPAVYCYCSPLTGTILHTATTPTIDSVSILSTTLNNADIGAPTNGYTMFPASGSTTATLVAGTSYTLNTFYAGGTPAIASFWGDWNQDGVYDSTEWTQISTSSTGAESTIITVPSTAALGLTGIRIRARVSSSPDGATDACTTFGSGETEEYLVTITSTVPVTLKSFNGNVLGSANKLVWSTLNEANNNGFAIERSLDGIHYSPIGFVASLATNGNSTQQLNYEFTDAKPSVVSYYRLKRTDKNKSFAYSNVVVLKRDMTNVLSLVSVYPNPATNLVNLMVYAPHSEAVNLIITDLAGRVVLSKKTTLDNTNNNLQLDVTKLVSSNYIIKVVSNDGTETALGKFFKN